MMDESNPDDGKEDNISSTNNHVNHKSDELSPAVVSSDTRNSTPSQGGDGSESLLLQGGGNFTPRSDVSDQSRGTTPSLIKNPPENDTQGEDIEAYTNPEPPKELVDGHLLDADTIGGTVFSKHWLFTILMKLIETVDCQENDSEEKQLVLDIDDDLQDELCKLWDMSMNAEIVLFLQEFKAVDILSGVISKSRAPRVTEICIGILGNMACNDDVCVEISRNEKLKEMLLALFETPDSPTLVELTRLLHVCISCPKASGQWLDTIKKDQAIFSHISFILQSSTNSDLLVNVGELVGSVLYADDEACCIWSNPETVLGVLEALKQLGSEPALESLETFLHILQLVSTCEPGVEALVSYGSDLVSLTMKYLCGVCEEDLVGIDGKQNSLGSALSVINVLLASWEDRQKFIQEDYQLVRCVLKILEELLPEHSSEAAARLQRHRSQSTVDGGEAGERGEATPFHSYTQSTESQRSTQGGACSQESEVTQSNSEEQSDSHRDMDVDDTHKKEGDTSHNDDITTRNDDITSSNDDITTCKDNGDNTVTSSNPQRVTEHNGCSSTESKDRKTSRVGSVSSSSQLGGSMSRSSSKAHLQECEEYDRKMTRMLYDVIQACLVEVVGILKEICFQSGAQVEPNTATNTDNSPLSNHNSDLAPSSSTFTPILEIGIPETLDYLDTKCQSLRLRYMLHVLKQSSNGGEGQTSNSEDGQTTDYIHIMHLLARKYDAQKIERILTDFY